MADALKREDSTQREIDNLIQQVEQQLDRALQRFPGDEFLLSAEAEFAALLRDDERVLSALQKAFSVNRRSPFIARTLSKTLRDRDKPDDAVNVLEEALEANPGERKLHHALAMHLIELGVEDSERVVSHLRRSFTPGDDNYEAQFWYATYLFMGGHVDESRALFDTLSAAPLAHNLRTRIRTLFRDPGDDEAFQFTGRIVRLETSYGFIERDGPGDWIFMHHDSFGGRDWLLLSLGQLVTFQIGFNFFGPIATKVSGQSP